MQVYRGIRNGGDIVSIKVVEETDVSIQRAVLREIKILDDARYGENGASVSCTSDVKCLELQTCGLQYQRRYHS